MQNTAPNGAVRVWHASRALGAGAYPHHAGQDLRAHDAKKTRQCPPHQHEVGTVAPGTPSMPSRRLRPKRPKWQLDEGTAASSPWARPSTLRR